MQLPSTLTADQIDELLARVLLVFARRGAQITRGHQESEDRPDDGDSPDLGDKERTIVYEQA